MSVQSLFLILLGTSVLVMGLRRLLARRMPEVKLEDFQVAHPVDAFDMPDRDKARWSRSYSGH